MTRVRRWEFGWWFCFTLSLATCLFYFCPALYIAWWSSVSIWMIITHLENVSGLGLSALWPRVLSSPGPLICHPEYRPYLQQKNLNDFFFNSIFFKIDICRFCRHTTNVWNLICVLFFVIISNEISCFLNILGTGTYVTMIYVDSNCW